MTLCFENIKKVKFPFFLLSVLLLRASLLSPAPVAVAVVFAPVAVAAVAAVVAEAVDADVAVVVRVEVAASVWNHLPNRNTFKNSDWLSKSTSDSPISYIGTFGLC